MITRICKNLIVYFNSFQLISGHSLYLIHVVAHLLTVSINSLTDSNLYYRNENKMTRH